MERLYFGDNLQVLREHIRDESVDLIYLDPPFNSKRDYNLLFKSPKGHDCDAQITAFEDSWHWGEQAEREFSEILHQGNTQVAEMMAALRAFLGENDMMAYLTMMANRLLELHRVLKPTGSLYLHCDPTASHYLRILLDAVFSPINFRNEISWCYRKWSVAAGQFSRNHDCILFYSKSKGKHTFNVQHVDVSTGTVKRWKGKKQQAYFEEGIRKAGDLSEEDAKSPCPDWWELSIINPNSKERLGYPTQKPLTLLERIIQASSNEGDVVLDPFCGCGTAVHAAQKLNRRWIGMDITHLAIALIERRLRDAFPGLAFEVQGTPKDLEGARELARRAKYQFQWWACALVQAQPYQGKKKGADNGIDGLIYFQEGREASQKIIVSVKGGEHVSVAMVRDLKGVIERERAAMGVFVTLTAPTRAMRTEAVAAGFYDSPHFPQHAYPRVQIVSIEGLLRGTEQPRYPDLSRGERTFKRAGKEIREPRQAALL